MITFPSNSLVDRCTSGMSLPWDGPSIPISPARHGPGTAPMQATEKHFGSREDDARPRAEPLAIVPRELPKDG